jgi:hypothetical protein
VTVKALIFGASDSELAKLTELVVKYLSEYDGLRTVQVTAERRDYGVPSVNAAVHHADLQDAIKSSERKNDIIISTGSLWKSVAEMELQLRLGSGSEQERVRLAHNVLVVEQLLAFDVSNWNFIFYKPVDNVEATVDEETENLDVIYGSLYLTEREKFLPNLGPFVMLPQDFDDAAETMVREINGALGLDDE